MIRRQRELVLLQHFLGLCRTQQLRLCQFLYIEPQIAHGVKGLSFIYPLAQRALGDKFVAGHRQTSLQRLHRQRPHLLDPAFQLIRHLEVVRHAGDIDALQRGDQRPVSSAGHDGAHRLGGAPAAPLALRQRRVRTLGDLDGCEQLFLEQLDATRGRLPTLDVGRLHDDQLDLGRAIERPLRDRRPHGRSGVEHKLWIFFHIDGDAIAKLPIDNVRRVANATDDVGGPEHVGQQIAEPDDDLGLVFHLLVGVDLVERRQRGHQFVVDQILIERHVGMNSAKKILRRGLAIQHVGDDVVEQGAGVGVDAGRFGRHLGDERHGAWAVDDALGGGPADDCGMLSH